MSASQFEGLLYSNLSPSCNLLSNTLPSLLSTWAKRPHYCSNFSASLAQALKTLATPKTEVMEMRGTRKRKLFWCVGEQFLHSCLLWPKFIVIAVMSAGVPKGSCQRMDGYVILLFLLTKFMIIFYLRLLQMPWWSVQGMQQKCQHKKKKKKNQSLFPLIFGWLKKQWGWNKVSHNEYLCKITDHVPMLPKLSSGKNRLCRDIKDRPDSSNYKYVTLPSSLL